MKKKVCALFLAFVMALGMLPAAAIEAGDAPAPFTALSGEVELTVAQSEEDYTYTDWSGAEFVVDLYQVTVPAGAEGVTLDFGQELRIAYGYAADGTYVDDCSSNEGGYADNGQTGETTAVVPAELPDYVHVQTPYDAAWSSELLYAVTFETEQSEEGDTDGAAVSVDALLTNIAASYAETTDIWDIVSSGMYETAYPEKVAPDAGTRQTRVDAILATLEGDGIDDGAAAKAILALRSLGYDPEQLTAADGAAVSAVAKLTAAATNNIYNAPYVLLAYQQGEYDAEKEQAVLSFVLDSQGEDGSWTGSPDTTGIMLAALTAYTGDAGVDAAMAAGADYLKNAISEQGDFGMTWAGSTTYNADSTAMAVIGLHAAALEPALVQHHVSGISALDGLLAYALADNSGFGYTDNTTLNDFATKDGFRALIAVDKGVDYDIFDFTTNTKLPAAATQTSGGGDEDSGSQGGGSDDDEITITFQLRTHQDTWIDEHEVTVDEDATVGDVFYQVLESREAFSFVDNNGYISSITKGYATWAEFDAGPNSGWKYMVNGVAPGMSMNDKTLEDGDAVVWYYVTDYTQDTDRDEDRYEKEEEEPLPEMTFADVEGHWAYDAIEYCYDEGLMSGTGETAFSPDMPMDRAMVVTILYAMEDKPETDAENPFGDVEADGWYTDAVLWAAEKGVVSGYGNGSFGPNDPVTREQLAAILWQYAKSKKVDVSVGENTNILSYTDAFAISDWAFSGLQWACGSGLMDGHDGAIMPGGAATRGQMATILMNYLENLA